MNEEIFIKECLDEHNRCRLMHGVSPLKHSDELDKTAQEWADSLITKERLECSPVSCRGEVGENISSHSTTASTINVSGTDVANKWYSDIKKYDFTKAAGTAGHFTQLIWKSTEEIGFGVATLKGKCVIVAHYKPPGNVKGSFAYNVPPFVCTDGGSVATYSPVSCPVLTTSVCPKMEVWTNEISAYKTPATHVRTDSMSSDEHFELTLHELSDIGKARKREVRQFVRDVISEINRYRVKHNVPILKHNKELDDISQSWAEELLPNNCLSNSGNRYKGEKLGESIASRFSTAPCVYKAEEVVEHWYNEIKKYVFGEEPSNVQGIGNFTQMLWKSSKEIGIGKASLANGKNNRVVIVCNFHPGGNVLKRFKENVLPASN